MSKITDEDEDLIKDLGIEIEVKKKSSLSQLDERIISGFEDIQNFVNENEREPTFGNNKDIFESIYATRLDAIRRNKENVKLLKDFDHQGLLDKANFPDIDDNEVLDDDALLEDLGISPESEPNNLTNLKHVKPRSEINNPSEIGDRKICKDFTIFKPLFDTVQKDIEDGRRKTILFEKDSKIELGNFFILSGQKVFVAHIGDVFIGQDGRKEFRLRIIFDNGVESNQLMRSLQKRLWEDKTSRRITSLDMGPLFSDTPNSEDHPSGTIYICRSKSDHDLIKMNRNIIHKIGVTNQNVESRLSGAKDDPTFLFADAELVAKFELFNINRNKLEKLLHNIFKAAQLDIDIPDRFGKNYKPKEWFLISLDVIQEAVDRLKDGSIEDYIFNKETGLLEKI